MRSAFLRFDSRSVGATLKKLGAASTSHYLESVQRFCEEYTLMIEKIEGISEISLENRRDNVLLRFLWFWWGAKEQKQSTAGIRWWSPTQLLTGRHMA
jgi:hypothetical protein